VRADGNTLTITPSSSSSGITIGSGVQASSIAAPLVLGADQTWTISSAAANKLTVSGAISGAGGLTKSGSGVLLLTSNNKSYGGPTVVRGGVLQLGTAYTDADSIPGGISTAGLTTGSNLEINGGNVRLAYYLRRSLGAGPGQLQITGGTSGFSHTQADSYGRIAITNDANYEIVWGSAYFKPDVLVLNEAAAVPDQIVNIQNKLDLNGATRTIACNATSAVSGGYINANNYNMTTCGGAVSGIIRNSGGVGAPAGLIKTGPGILILAVANTYNGGTTVSAGTLQLNAANTGNQSSIVTIATGAKLTLNFTGTDTVKQFIIGTEYKNAGVYGHTNSGATNGGLGVGALDSYFGAGTGTLTVTDGPPPPLGTMILIY
jgi:fibronectin-binding autotransporter adhesin